LLRHRGGPDAGRVGVARRQEASDRAGSKGSAAAPLMPLVLSAPRHRSGVRATPPLRCRNESGRVGPGGRRPRLSVRMAAGKEGTKSEITMIVPDEAPAAVQMTPEQLGAE